MNNHLIVIDPQNDFTHNHGALFVPGADQDMQRLTRFLQKWGSHIDDIHVTLDSHREVDIAHAIFWVDSNGKHPDPFTTITLDDLDAGIWRTRHPGWQQRARSYLHQLDQNGRYNLTIWPAHCIIGSWGHAIHAGFSDALRQWEREHFAIVDYVTKGSNIWTEHYSAVRAEVEDPADATTQLNTALIDILQDPQLDRILIAGEALSHCVANTIRDIADNFGEENIRKFCLLQDCSSSVAGCEALGEAFVADMIARGMQCIDSTVNPFNLVPA